MVEMYKVWGEVAKKVQKGRKKSFSYYLLIISMFVRLVKKISKNNSEKICRFQKKPYLCIAFETEV